MKNSLIRCFKNLVKPSDEFDAKKHTRIVDLRNEESLGKNLGEYWPFELNFYLSQKVEFYNLNYC